MTDTLRDEIAAALTGYAVGAGEARDMADALLPLIEARERAAAARALTEVANECALDHDARGYVVVQMSTETWNDLLRARAASQAAPPEETHEHTMTDWDGTRATCRCGASRAVHGPWRMPSPAAPVSPEENTT